MPLMIRRVLIAVGVLVLVGGAAIILAEPSGPGSRSGPGAGTGARAGVRAVILVPERALGVRIGQTRTRVSHRFGPGRPTAMARTRAYHLGRAVLKVTFSAKGRVAAVTGGGLPVRLGRRDLSVSSRHVRGYLRRRGWTFLRCGHGDLLARHLGANAETDVSWDHGHLRTVDIGPRVYAVVCVPSAGPK